MPAALIFIGGCKANGEGDGPETRLAFAATLPADRNESMLPAGSKAAMLPVDSNASRLTQAVKPPSPATGEQKPSGRCPPEMAGLGAYCIDRYEAHLVVVEPDGSQTTLPHQKRPEPGQRYRAASAAGVMPQAFLNRAEAQSACEAAGKRLCSSSEWLLACEGAEGSPFPYGNTFRRGACNSGKPHLMQKLFGRDSRTYTYDHHYNSPRLALEPGFLAMTGEHADCTSPGGVHDLVGNLHEWVSDPVDHAFRKMLIHRKADYKVLETAKDGNAAFLGGFYSTTDQLGTGCGYITAAHAPDYHDYSIGFRCCRDASE